MTWQPVVIALAALITACTPGCASFVVALANHRRLGAMHDQSNGNLLALREEIAGLRAELAAAGIPAVTRASHQ